MEEDKIKWCGKQKKGIELIEPKPYLNESYIKEAEEDFDELSGAGGKWRAIIAYYSCYEAFYSILMKCGIRCEIHDCSLELMGLFEFNEEDSNYIRILKKSREGNQYYLKRNLLKDVEKIKQFIVKCKAISNELNSEKIIQIRKRVECIIQK
jgi:uncharacterized protein (UPF0332 family)